MLKKEKVTADAIDFNVPRRVFYVRFNALLWNKNRVGSKHVLGVQQRQQAKNKRLGNRKRRLRKRAISWPSLQTERDANREKSVIGINIKNKAATERQNLFLHNISAREQSSGALWTILILYPNVYNIYHSLLISSSASFAQRRFSLSLAVFRLCFDRLFVFHIAPFPVYFQ